MRRRQFLQGSPAVVGAALAGKTQGNPRQSSKGPVLEKVVAFSPDHDPHENSGGSAVAPLGTPSEEVPVPVIGLGESGRLATSPGITTEAPNTPFWRIVEVGRGTANSSEGRTPSESALEAAHTIAGDGAVRDALIAQVDLLSHPLVIFVGNPKEPFVAQQLGWLREILSQASTRVVWIRPPDQPGLRESPVAGSLLEMAPELEASDQTRQERGLPPKPTGYYPTLLWGLLASLGRPSLIGFDLADTLTILKGQRAAFAKALTKGPDRMATGVHSLIRQAQGSWGAEEKLKGVYFQVWAPPEMGIDEVEAGVQQVSEEFDALQSEDFPLVVGMPIGDYAGLFKDKVALSLVANFGA